MSPRDRIRGEGVYTASLQRAFHEDCVDADDHPMKDLPVGREGEVTEVLPTEVLLPAAGQGALAVTIREGDAAAEARVVGLADVRTATAVIAEREALHELKAGCHAPVGELADVEDGRVRLRVRVLSRDGTTAL